MRNGWRASRALLTAALFAFVIHHSTFVLSAFPPALPHTIYGMARDEYGNPLRTNATIVLTTSSGATVTAIVDPEDEPGVNYRLVVPLDAAVKSDAYKTGALQGSVPFRLYVKVNNATFLPLEMIGDFSLLGQPGKQTRIDLTLGEDTNGNGLPDAWERAMLAARGWTNSLADLKANSILGGNGITLLQEYVAGTYGFEDANGLNLNIVRVEAGAPVFEFLAVRGRSYTLLGSADLKAWGTIAFRPLLPDADPEATQTAYLSTDVRLLQVAVPAPATGPAPRFFKLKIQ
jgi:hypothetical protein